MNNYAFLPSPPGRGVGGEGRNHKVSVPPDLLEFARRLRTEQTEPETLLWFLLRNRRLLGYKFRRQHAFPPYVLDFYCDELKLAVELDGSQHNQDIEAARDKQRDAFILARGVMLIRYWNHDVLQKTEDVLCDLVERILVRPRPSPGASRHPLPEGEGIQ
jgi:very-short-patch-repair endonuclease